MNADVTIVVIDYKSRPFLIDLVESIATKATRVTQLIVVDNNPTPLLPLKMDRLPFPVTLVRPERNLGFTAGNNFGFRSVSSEFVLFMNPDMLLLNDVPGMLSSALEDRPDVGVVGPKFLNPDGTHQISTRTFPSLRFALAKTIPILRRRYRREWMAYYDHTVDPNREKHVDTVSTGAFMIRSDLYRQLNGFDETTFMYGEDAELCKRVRDLGLSVLYYPDAELIHHGGQSSKKSSRIAVRSYYQSFYYLFKKHVVGAKMKPFWPLFWLAAEIHIARMSFESDKRLTWTDKS